MKSNFHQNQIIYVKGIGYARIAKDGQKNPKNSDGTKPAQNQNQNDTVPEDNDENIDSVLFDPDMFQIDTDSPYADSQVEVNLPENSTRKSSVEVLRRHSAQFKIREQIIVPLIMEKCNVMIYCPQTLLMRKITVVVRSLLQNCRKEVQLQVQIVKTIDNFKISLFKELGQEIACYSDVRMYTTAPLMEELNIGSKTIYQYLLKDKCKITLTGKFNFSFKPLPKEVEQHYVLSNGNNSFGSIVKKTQTSTNTPPSSENVPITPVTTVPTIAMQQQPKPEQQPKVQTTAIVSTQQKPQQVQQPPKPQQQQKQKSPQKQRKIKEIEALHLQCNVKLRSGIHYWEIRIDKLSPNKEQNSLLIGICLKTEDSSKNSEFSHLWAFDPLRCKKVEHSGENKTKLAQKDDKQQNGSDQSDEEYGCFVKNGDIVGVLLIIKEKRATLIFYKNQTCLQECYEFGVQQLRNTVSKNKAYLCPFINVKGEIQLVLDSKAIAPLDSYRFK